MGYYDNVKDDVKDNDDTSKPNFDTLRKAAEETDSEDDREGDDTDIEVLEDGLNKSSSGSSSSGIKELGQDDQKETGTSSSGKSSQSSSNTASNVSADMSGVEQKLDKIIEQNERMIDILESFGS